MNLHNRYHLYDAAVMVVLSKPRLYNIIHCCALRVTDADGLKYL